MNDKKGMFSLKSMYSSKKQGENSKFVLIYLNFMIQVFIREQSSNMSFVIKFKET